MGCNAKPDKPPASACDIFLLLLAETVDVHPVTLVTSAMTNIVKNRHQPWLQDAIVISKMQLTDDLVETLHHTSRGLARSDLADRLSSHGSSMLCDSSWIAIGDAECGVATADHQCSFE